MSKSTSTLLPTSLVGSYPQPTWLIDRDKLAKQMPPRVRASPLWRIDSDYLVEAQDDATLLAIRDQERAGLDIITDGEVRRESYSNRFATALAGLDLDNPAGIPSSKRPSHSGTEVHCRGDLRSIAESLWRIPRVTARKPSYPQLTSEWSGFAKLRLIYRDVSLYLADDN